jgi:hypothetical protein
MAGGTHVFDMIKRLKENANLRNKRNFFKAKHNYPATSNLADNKIETQEQHQQILEKAKVESIRERRRLIIVLIISVLTVATLVLLFLKFVKL